MTRNIPYIWQVFQFIQPQHIFATGSLSPIHYYQNCFLLILKFQIWTLQDLNYSNLYVNQLIYFPFSLYRVVFTNCILCPNLIWSPRCIFLISVHWMDISFWSKWNEHLYSGCNGMVLSIWAELECLNSDWNGMVHSISAKVK